MSKLKPLYIITVTLSFCSIVYELLLANTLTIMTQDHIWWQSMTIGFYIGGLGIGSYMAEVRKVRTYDHLLKVELMLSLLGAISVFYLYLVHGTFRVVDFLTYISSDHYSSLYVQNLAIFKTLFFVLVEGLTFAIGILSGFEIPLLISLTNKSEKKDRTYFVLALNYTGTLLGSLVFTFYLLPQFDVLFTAIIVSSVNFAICLYLLITKKATLSGHRRKAIFALICVCISFIVIKSEPIKQYYLKTFYLFQKRVTSQNIDILKFYENIDEIPDVERKKSLYQYLDIYKLKDRLSGETDTIMTLDTAFQFSTFNEKFYHEGFAHVPMIFTNQKPKNVLVLGGGDGLLIRELLKREHIESIKQIELDEDVVNLAKNRDFLKKLNRNSMNDPKVETIISDAFYYLRNNRELFDAIFIDFPYPRNYNLAKLYSLEFYTYVNKNLKPHGFVVLDAPIYNKFDYGKEKYRGRAILASTFSAIDKQNNSVLVSTIHYAGFDKIYPYKISGESFIIATNNNSNLNYQISEGDRSYFEAIEEKDLLKIPSQNFPHEINRKYINSIFHPRMLHDRTL